jgi:hypothetical protein
MREKGTRRDVLVYAERSHMLSETGARSQKG